MHTAVTAGDVLRKKGQGYWAVAPSTTAYDALELMADRNIGALLVMDGSRLVGVFSERDYARKVILLGRSSRTTVVEELMGRPPICAGPTLTLHECMVMMTGNHVRHLPVVDNGVVTGMLSIGDVVKAVISDQEETIHQLENYISGDDYARTVAHP